VGTEQEINERFLGWAERWDELGTQLQTYANYHPSDKAKTQPEEVCTAVVAAFGATRYLSLFPRSDTMDAFNDAPWRPPPYRSADLWIR
jgi:hypothetical protein